VRPLEVVLAPSVTSYRVAGYAPVRIVVAPPGHTAFNTQQDYVRRQRAARRFFFDASTSVGERKTILRRYDVRWVVVDQRRSRPPMPPGLELTYADKRYALYRVPREEES
jgi:hypothetical protein